uniref:Putative hydroxyacylglutathione hydrolase n=1 Tax=uncultured bacterium MedeBAC46A06 TaxID=332275 RepID=Q4PJC5_9BACT|nr:putative hydroxyacylglutathione hydrolase [uncultured bacterium MedeBAC46A06]
MRPDRRVASAKERVGGLFQCHQCRHGGLSGGAKLLHCRGTSLQRVIARVDAERETRIGGGIFMGAIDHRIIGKRHQCLEAVPHHWRVTLEQPPTSHGKQRVAGKDQIFCRKVEVQHVERMARGGNHLDLAPGKGKAVAAGQKGADMIDAAGPEHVDPVPGQVGKACHVISMVVGDPDLRQWPA